MLEYQGKVVAEKVAEEAEERREMKKDNGRGARKE